MSYRLTIHDDADHTFGYVIRLFVHVLGVGFQEAFDLAWSIHEKGTATVNFYELANAREVEERLLSGGPDRGFPGSRASLAVSIEEVQGESARLLSRGRVGARGYEPLDEAQVARLHEESLSTHGHAPRCLPALMGWTGPRLLFAVALAGTVLYTLFSMR